MARPKKLAICRGCEQFVRIEDVMGDCPHCGTNVVQAALRYMQAKQRVDAVIERMEKALEDLQAPPPSNI